MVAEALDGEVPDVDPVHQHRPGVHVVEPGDEAGDGRLTASGTPHQRHGLPGLDGQRETVKHHRVIAAGIGEPDVAELDPARRVADRAGSWPVPDHRVLVENLEDPHRGGRGPLVLEEDEAEHPEGHGDHDHVGAEGQQSAHPDLAVDGQPAPIEEDHGHAQAGDRLDSGVEPGPGVDQGGRRPAEPTGGSGQSGDLVGFGGERLDDPGATDVLVDHHRHLGHPPLGDP